MTFLDFTFLKTLPTGQIRNGFAELIKISSVSELRTWQLLEGHGEALIETSFGRADGAKEDILPIAEEVCRRGITHMLDVSFLARNLCRIRANVRHKQLESPNLHEIGLDRVIAFGHSLSPTLELKPEIPLRHGHAICIDMAYFTTFAWTRGYINEAERNEIHGLMSRVGLSLDHELFDEGLIVAGNEAILQTRDGKQRYVVPKPIGTPYFVNDASQEEMFKVLKIHKDLCKNYPRNGAGLEAYVDAGDLGQSPEEMLKEKREAAHIGKDSNQEAANAQGANVSKNGSGYTQAISNGCCN